MAAAHHDDGLRVGELAEATGLTVRTLHHYESIGLLVASGRSEAGHRRYDVADVDRLYRICLLRDLGLGLPEVARALDDPSWAIGAALDAHLDELDRRLAATAGLRRRVAALARSAADAQHPTTTDLTTLVEEMTMLDTALERRIAILVYADIEAAHAYLARVFGMVGGELTRDDGGTVVHGELEAGDGVIWLHREAPEFALASPQALGGASGMVAVLVDDVDAHHAHAVAEGADIRYEPVDQPYGFREYGARDPEGHLWSFMKPLG
ncbi:MAG: MerR family transcriptional regulator [Acidimicrobiales bacterium]|nr:MerR family transcriptional regulator [Acidimicrobiales bacterium]